MNITTLRVIAGDFDLDIREGDEQMRTVAHLKIPQMYNDVTLVGDVSRSGDDNLESFFCCSLSYSAE